MRERWLQIQEFPRYSISSKGRVRNDDTGRIMSMVTNGAGVLAVYLVRDGRQYSRGVARLVANHFLPHNTNELFDTPLHLDGDRLNNDVENLVWRPRWYATAYLRQFEEYRVPFVNRPMIETTTGLIFDNSWEAAKHFGLLETKVAKSYHLYQGGDETEAAWPTFYCFRRYG